MKGPELVCYSDSDWGGSEKQKSTSGHITLYGNWVVAWCSKKQTCVAVSTAEAEYVAGTLAAQEILFERCLLCDAGINISRSDIKCHFIRHCVEEAAIQTTNVKTDLNLADIFTKPVNGVILQRATAVIFTNMDERNNNKALRTGGADAQ